MAIYDKATWQLMIELASELLRQPDDIVTKSMVHEWFQRQYPRIKQGTIDAHLARMSTNHPSRVHYNARPGQDDLFFRIDSQRYRRFNPNTDPTPISMDRTASTEDESIDEAALLTVGDSEFAYESDLRDYLARNLGTIESGLRLYQEDGIQGVEYPVGGRFIDILAVDSNGGLVVIELKVSRGYDRVIGQLLRYVGWIRSNLAEQDQPVRGIIIAREISEDLRIACREAQNIKLLEYRLSVELFPVS